MMTANTKDSTQTVGLGAMTGSGCPECAARSSAQWVKAYGKANLGVDRATGHCRNCRHRFHAEDSYFPDEGDYCSAVDVDEIQFCPAWREHCQNETSPSTGEKGTK